MGSGRLRVLPSRQDRQPPTFREVSEGNYLIIPCLPWCSQHEKTLQRRLSQLYTLFSRGQWLKSASKVTGTVAKGRECGPFQT